MFRSLLVASFVLVSSVSSAQTVKWSVDLTTLGLGPIYAVVPIELDGQPGSEYLVKLHTFMPSFRIVVPTSPKVVCGTVELPWPLTLLDSDGDGRTEYLAFDVSTQRLTARDFDLASCR